MQNPKFEAEVIGFSKKTYNTELKVKQNTRCTMSQLA